MNPKKIRKPLDETLADNFVYGESKPASLSPEAEITAVENESKNIAPIESEKLTAVESSKELSLMDKLRVQSKEATKRFTVDLEESLHRKLSILAAKTGRSKADIVRLLLNDALEDVRE
jgi:predicted HicB family RNase H-like nuclease